MNFKDYLCPGLKRKFFQILNPGVNDGDFA